MCFMVPFLCVCTLLQDQGLEVTVEPAVLVETTVVEDELYADVKRQLLTWSDGSSGSLYYTLLYTVWQSQVENLQYSVV